MEFGSGVLGGETPVDGGSHGISFRLASADIPFQGVFVGVAPLETGPGQYAELSLRHPFVRLRTGFSQLPCLGVWWNSSRLAMRRSSAAGKVSYSDAVLWVFKLSKTTRTSGTSG